MSTVGFLAAPEATAGARQLFEDDVDEMGFVMNVSRLWAYQPATVAGLFDLMRQTCREHGLTLRQRGILVAAGASARGDSYCSLAWGWKLSREAGADVAAGVIRGDDAGLTPAERALAGWARRIVRSPHGTSETDVEVLREAGYTDSQIFAITVFVGLRLAFSSINNALGVRPDHELGTLAPRAVLDAVGYGRPMAEPSYGGGEYESTAPHTAGSPQ
jgi:uncharacterized peroxidase-related enzyme